MKKIIAAVLTCAIMLPATLLAQDCIFSGSVTGHDGNPLAGANVFIQGLPCGAATDLDGNYSFEVPRNLVQGQDAVLVANFIGYVTHRIDITITAGAHTYNFVLESDVLELDAVVVTGAGSQFVKRKLGMSVSNVRTGTMVQSSESNVVQQLAGKAPSVEIIQTSGDPGTSSYIKIRGVASIDRATQPLFVVDGVPIDNSWTNLDVGLGGTYDGAQTETSNRAADLNSEDIESVQILKGAAAAAIYGSRASNGVILITTKSGRPGQTKFSYKSSFGITEMAREYPLQRWYSEGRKGKYEEAYSRSWGRPLNVPDAPWYDPSLPEDEVYNHSTAYSDGGHINEQNLTISGGNQTTTFFLSGGYYFEKGHWEAGSDYERITARVKGTHQMNKRLKFTGNIAYAYTHHNAIQRGDNLAGMGIAALRSPPDFNNWPYIHPETGYHRSYRYPEAEVLRKGRGFDNPFFIMYEHKNPAEVNRVYGYVKAEYALADWFDVSYHLGSDYSMDQRAHIMPPSNSRLADGRIIRGDVSRHLFDSELQATIRGDKFLKDMDWLDATLMFGHNLHSRYYRRYTMVGQNMGTYEGFDQLDNCVDLTADEYMSRRNLESFYGQLTVDMFDQLYFTGALRNDGSSTFGVSQKRHWYPKASMAWEFTRAVDLPGVDFGKVRAALGYTGVQPGTYSTISAYKSASEEFGLYTNAYFEAIYNGVVGYRHSTTLGNDNIKPERQREWEIGLDMAFWNNRIGFEATYYDQLNTDVIFNINVPPSTGSFSQTANAATISNKGFELAVNLKPIEKRNFIWDLSLIFATNKSMVENMSGAEWEGMGGSVYAIPGYPMNTIRCQSWVRFGYDLMHDINGDGVDENIDEFYAGQWKKGDVWVGEDGKPVLANTSLITPFDVNPDWTGSIRTELTFFRNFSLSAFFDIVDDRWMDAYGASQLMRYGTHGATKHRWHPDTQDPEGVGTLDKWLVHGEKTIGPGAGVEFQYDEAWLTGTGVNYGGDRWWFIQNAGYVKLRELSLTWRIGSKFMSKFGLSDASIRIAGRNLFTWTDYGGWSPDTNRSQATNVQGVDYFNSPQTRAYTVTLRVNR